MASFDDLMKQLSPVNSGDLVTEVASAARMNAIQELIKMLVLGENIMEGPNIRKDSSQGKLILSADPSGKGLGGGTLKHPFKVRNASNDAGPRVSITPGVIEGIVPVIDTIRLDAIPAPTYGVTDGWIYFKVYLKARASAFSDFRTTVDKVEVIGFDTEQVELALTWTDESLGLGFFFIRIAGITIDDDDNIKQIDQYLTDNIRTFAIVVDEIIILS